jgi:uncharacterized membrane protein
MRQAKKRAMTWALVAVGVAMLAIGGTLAATFPWGQQGAFPFARMWSQGQSQEQGSSPGQVPQQGQPVPQDGQGAWMGPGGWYGYHHGWFMHGPRFFGGGFLVAFLVILLVVFIVRRRHWASWRDGPDRRLDAEEILRRSFAEGRITEEEYKSRLSALRK